MARRPPPLRVVGDNDSNERKFKQFRRFYSKFYKSSGKCWYRGRQWWMSLTDEERRIELNKRCTRCKAIGHNCVECPLPIVYKVPFPGSHSDGKRKYRCSRCHRLGHNIRSCHGPLV